MVDVSTYLISVKGAGLKLVIPYVFIYNTIPEFEHFHFIPQWILQSPAAPYTAREPPLKCPLSQFAPDRKDASETEDALNIYGTELLEAKEDNKTVSLNYIA